VELVPAPPAAAAGARRRSSIGGALQPQPSLSLWQQAEVPAVPPGRQVLVSAHATLQQLALSVQPSSAASSSGSAARPALHRLLLLDSAAVQAQSDPAPAAAASFSSSQLQQQQQQQQLALTVSAMVGLLQVAASGAVLLPLLQLAGTLYMPKRRHASVSSSAGAAAADGSSASKPRKQRKERVRVSFVQLQVEHVTASYADALPTCAAFAAPAAAEAAAGGARSQLALSAAVLHVQLQPRQRDLMASVNHCQMGYQVLLSGSCEQQQSVELMLLQGVQLRQHSLAGLVLLKVAAQQLRSDVHIDAVLGLSGMTGALLEHGAATMRQLQRRHASLPAAAAAQQSWAAAVAAAAVAANVGGVQAAAAEAVAAAAVLDEQGLVRSNPFTSLAQKLPPGPTTTSEARAAPATPGLPPLGLRLGSCSGAAATIQQQQQQQQQLKGPKQRALVAVEALLQDVAVQLSVCEHDALMMQAGRLRYSSVLEQAVLDKLRFAINDKTILQVPHGAVHQLPGWLPAGATAAAAAEAAAAPAAAAAAADEGPAQPRGAGSAQASPVSRATEGRQQAPLRGSGAAGCMPGLPEYGGAPDAAAAAAQAGSTAACGAGAVAGNVMSGPQFLDHPHPCSSIGSRRPASDGDAALYRRQAARQQAARERCQVPEPGATAAPAPDSMGGSSAGSVPRSSAVISLDVFAERVLLNVPHNEAPGRIIVVTETWAKAVKEVLKPQLSALKAQVGVLRAGAAALQAAPGGSAAPKPAKAKAPKPHYLELLVDLQQIVFALEQHPLETWMGLHGPLLQAVAAERHLAEQLLASCATAHGRISRSGVSGAAAATAGTGAAAIAPAGRRSQRFGSGRRRDPQQQQQQGGRRRWGALSKKGAGAVLSGIAAGSMTEAVAAAAAFTAAAVGPVASGITPRKGAAAAAAAGPAAAAAPAAPPLAAAPDAAAQGSAGGLPSAAGTAAAPPAEEASSPADSSVTAGALALGGDAAAATDVSDGEPGLAGDSSDGRESSDELDSSEDELGGLRDPDALAAALPSSASELAAAASGVARQGSGAMTPLAAAGAAGGAAPGAAADAAGSGAAAQAAAAEGSGAADGASASNEMAQAVLETHRELFEMYRYRCRPLAAASEDPYHHSRALMHLSCVHAEAVVLICLPGNPAADAMATEVCAYDSVLRLCTAAVGSMWHAMGARVLD
jgi:hypothetical protein